MEPPDVAPDAMLSPSSQPPFGELFTYELAHGTVVAVELPAVGRPPEAPSPSEIAGCIARLGHEKERAFAKTLAPRRAISFIGGRVALHLACERRGVEVGPILSTARGAPALPGGLTGSISHKRDIAVGLVTERGAQHVGIDIEELTIGRQNVARFVLTDRECAELHGLDEKPRIHAVLVRFSIKEAIYKALDPFVGRYVDFKEVEVRPHADGTAAVTMFLQAKEGPNEGPFLVEASWLLRDGYVLSSARASLKA